MLSWIFWNTTQISYINYEGIKQKINLLNSAHNMDTVQLGGWIIKLLL